MGVENAVRPAARDPLLGAVLDERYRVVDCIGRGGMGVVYRAEHVLLRKRVALKVLPLSASSESGAERFLREAQAAAAVGHEHVVDVTDMGTLPNGQHYIVLEYLEGMDLCQRVLRDGQLPVETVIDYMLQLCDGLEAVHAAGIVHRDLKPDNLFLVTQRGKDLLKILDFGVCKFRGGDGDAALSTDTGSTLGTPNFMAPEQVYDAKRVDHRADIYAIGATAYFMLTGRAPFIGSSLPGLLMAICHAPIKPVKELRPGMPEGLARAVTKALTRDVEQRFADCGELRAALLDVTCSPRGALEARSGPTTYLPVQTLVGAQPPSTALEPCAAAADPVDRATVRRTPTVARGIEAQAERTAMRPGSGGASSAPQTLPAASSLRSSEGPDMEVELDTASGIEARVRRRVRNTRLLLLGAVVLLASMLPWLWPGERRTAPALPKLAEQAADDPARVPAKQADDPGVVPTQPAQQTEQPPAVGAKHTAPADQATHGPTRRLQVERAVARPRQASPEPARSEAPSSSAQPSPAVGLHADLTGPAEDLPTKADTATDTDGQRFADEESKPEPPSYRLSTRGLQEVFPGPDREDAP